jgi:hypothetical protein
MAIQFQLLNLIRPMCQIRPTGSMDLSMFFQKRSEFSQQRIEVFIDICLALIVGCEYQLATLKQPGFSVEVSEDFTVKPSPAAVFTRGTRPVEVLHETGDSITLFGLFYQDTLCIGKHQNTSA